MLAVESDLPKLFSRWIDDLSAVEDAVGAFIDILDRRLILARSSTAIESSDDIKELEKVTPVGDSDDLNVMDWVNDGYAMAKKDAYNFTSTKPTIIHTIHGPEDGIAGFVTPNYSATVKADAQN